MLTDTHSHPYYCEDPEGFVRRAVEKGVNRIIMPNVDLESVGPMKALSGKFPDNLRMAMGLHPTEVKENADEVLDEILRETEGEHPYVAIGEVGMDLYWDKTFAEKQMQIFDRQLSHAEKLGLPVIIHCREALDETLEVLSGHKENKVVFHSFGGSRKDAERVLLAGDDNYIGINGIVTFKNSDLKNVLPVIPAERILLETDSPYLAPVPHRGKKNESAYLPFIARAVAEALNTTFEKIARITSENSLRLFNW